MSDTEGNRPDPHDAASSAVPENPATAPGEPATGSTESAQQPAAATPDHSSAAAPDHSAAAAPQSSAAPASSSAGSSPAAPGSQPAVPPPYTGSYAGQSSPAAKTPYPASPAQPGGQSFGPAAQPGRTAPTLPLGGTDPSQPYGTTGEHAAATSVATKKRSNAGRIAGLLVAAAIVGGAAGLGGAYAGVSIWGTSSTTTASGGTVVTVNNTDSVTNTTAVAAKVVPSVVTIDVSGGSSSSTSGTGSGVVLSEDGYILTNTHVVTLDGEISNPTISVTTSDGRIYSATVVGTDPTYDLAVIKLDGASGLTPITWGDSTQLNVGDETIAVGAPLGLSNTVTEGIVSALNRSIEISSSAAPDDSGDSGDSGDSESPFYFDFGQGDSSSSTTDTIKIAVIQTDAAINPGNSGGALVNSSGDVIGINVAIASASSSSSTDQSGSIGVGFAIPSSVAERVAQEIIDTGTATHGLLGASVQDATSVEGATITGAYIAEVTSGGAAAAAGLQEGDIVTEFNGASISDSVDLTAQVRAAAGGSTATLTYVRNGQSHTATVTLGTLDQ